MAKPKNFVYRPRSHEQVVRYARSHRFVEDCIRPAYDNRRAAPLANYLRSDLPLTDEHREALAMLIELEFEPRGRGQHRKPIPSRVVTKAEVVRMVDAETDRMRAGNNGKVPWGGYRAAVEQVERRLVREAEDGEIVIANELVGASDAGQTDAKFMEVLLNTLQRGRRRRRTP